MADLRRVRSRAWRAAIRAREACWALSMMPLASPGLRSNQSRSLSLVIFCTNDLASVLPSLVLVWPSNWGSASLMETIAVRPAGCLNEVGEGGTGPVVGGFPLNGDLEGLLEFVFSSPNSMTCACTGSL